MNNSKLTKQQEEKIYLLRLDGLRREIELHEAEEAYTEAKAKEQAVQQFVIEHNEYYADVPEDELEHGKRITDGKTDYLMNDTVFVSDYMPKLKAAFMELYGIDNPLNFVYSEPFRAKAYAAEQAYLMIAVDFLKICGAPEAESLGKSVKTYMRDELKQRLIDINKEFIAGTNSAERKLNHEKL